MICAKTRCPEGELNTDLMRGNPKSPICCRELQPRGRPDERQSFYYLLHTNEAIL